MGLILYDHTERKVNTRLPQTVIQAGRALNGLESTTGADLLISPLSLPVKDLCDDMALKLLKKHIDAGVLIQRKSGRDAVSSIPNYPAILQRMLEWTTRPWLITIGQYGSSKEGKVIVDGQETEWTWNAFQGALDWWQLRGGYVANLSRDGQLLGYLNQWLERLGDENWDSTTEYKVVYRVPKQVIGEPDWVSIVLGMGIGFGSEKVEFLQDNFRGLGDFFTFFSDEDNAKSRLIKATKGIGPSHFRKVRGILNIQPENIFIQKYKGEAIDE